MGWEVCRDSVSKPNDPRTAEPMSHDFITLAGPTDVGEIGVFQLKRLWSRVMARRQGQAVDAGAETTVDHVVIDALGVGLEQTLQYLYRAAPSFEEFEQDRKSVV